jgi:ankyrin repeat protein
MAKGACLALVALLALPALLRAQAASSDPELDTGVRLVDEGDFEEAVKRLSGVVQRLEKQPGHARELGRAYLYLAIAYLQLSEEQKAKAQFIEAWKSDQSLKLSPHEFPPKVISAFKQALEEARAAAPAGAAAAARPRNPALVPVFFEAVKAGDFPAVRNLLVEDPALVTEKDAVYEATPLHWAALRGNEAIVALLLAEGADSEARNKDGETAYEVARRGRKPELTRLLAPTTGFPGFLEAVKRGDLAGVQKLVADQPGLVNERDSAFGATGLHWAALRGHAPVAQLLLERGANPQARNKEGETALQVAERAKKQEVVQVLRVTGTRPAAGGGATASDLIEAAKRGDLARVRTLLAADASLLAATDREFGATPLHWAALKGHASVVQFLVAQGADTQARNGEGETPLQVAQRAGKKDVVALLER